jgi:excisionase family DNA binding protein
MTLCILDTNKEIKMEVKLLTVRELASYLGVSIRQIYRLIDSGMPSLRVGKYHRFNKDDIDKWTKKCQN